MRLFRIHHAPSRVEQHEQSASKEPREVRARVCERICASRAKDERATPKKGEKKREKKNVRLIYTPRTYARTLARSLARNARARFRERRAAADFAFCSRCFLCVLLPLSFSAAFLRSSSLSSSLYLAFSSRLTRPVKSGAFFLLSPFFARHRRRNAIFEALPPATFPSPARHATLVTIYDANQKRVLRFRPSRILLPVAFYGTNARASDDCDESRLKIGYVEPSSC